MELITDLKAINKEIGLRLEESSLYPKLNLDAYKDVTPILIKKDKQYALLLKEVETGNFTPGGRGSGRSGNAKSNLFITVLISPGRRSLRSGRLFPRMRSPL